MEQLCKCKKCDKGPGHLLVMLSLATLIISAVVSIFKVEMYLAGTQWILVSILLAIYASIFFLTNCNCDCEKK